MRIRFCRFDRSFGARNFEQPRKLLKRLSQRVPQSVDRALGPDVLKDEAGDDQTKKDSDDTIADVIEIGIGRVTLKDAVEESECDLQPSITDPFASRRDPARDGRGTSDEDDKRCDRFHVRHKEYDGEKRERSADHATDDSQSAFIERCLSTLERDECAGK